MKEDIPRNGKTLSRKEMLERHRRREYEDTGKELNEFSRRALAGLQYHSEEEALESTLARLDRRLGAAPGRPFRLRHILSMAAAAALLLAAGYFLFLRPPSNEALFAQHFDYLPSAVDTEGVDRNLPSAYSENASPRARAMRAYETGDHQRARKLMEEHLSENERDAEARLYLGIVLLGEGETEPAISNLEAALPNLPKPAYLRPASWYLGLAYLKNGQPEEARERFLQLRDGKDRYAKGARAVLKKL
ncbi:MAG: tetratricopeptide repeat protein [Phaeodactylibacter sp.]|nr:tetratricopeptide repeat protein [Phaeodactylibacter sp.]